MRLGRALKITLLWTLILIGLCETRTAVVDAFVLNISPGSNRSWRGSGPEGVESDERSVRIRRRRLSSLGMEQPRRCCPIGRPWQQDLAHIVTSSLMGLALLVSPIHEKTTTGSSFSLSVPAAHAAATHDFASVLLEAAPEARTMAGNNLKRVSPKPRTSVQQPAMNVVDEVWTLVNKYYIDRSFNGQDWEAVRLKYSKMHEKYPDDDASLKMAAEMVKSLGDKYSRMLDVKQYAAIQKFDLIGVGVTLMPNDKKEIVVGAPPVAGSASAKAGMQIGDQVLAVNTVPTEGRTAFDIIDQISENPDAKSVTMTVKSQDDGNVRDLTMARAFSEAKDPVLYKVSETRSDGTKVGFIRISEFNSRVKSRLEDALKDLQAQGITALVIDLRGNPGGAFQSAVEISSLFVDNRVATYVVDSNMVELPFRTGAGQVVVDPKIPIALWLDGRSASASEVLAGSLHDNCRAVVMGEKSFGKGLIQAVYGLKNGAGLVLTVARYVTPNGTEIQGVGISPDIADGVPPFFPGVGTDSSRVDFSELSRRLDPSMCTRPNR